MARAFVACSVRSNAGRFSVPHRGNGVPIPIEAGEDVGAGRRAGVTAMNAKEAQRARKAKADLAEILERRPDLKGRLASRAEREGGSGRLAPNRSRRLHDAGIAPRKLAQDAQP